METTTGTKAQKLEIWQTKIPTIKGRTEFVFNNEVMSDVRFVVAATSDETSRATGSKRAKMAIPAHKFVLSISSPVFYAMFYGEMAETTDSIELPDCEYESLLELFRYLYTDRAILSGSNVMEVYYLAKKYMVPSLADECAKYLRKNVEGFNAFTILLHAQKFGEKQLEDRCWEVIKTQATEAVKSDEFSTLERPLVESVVKQEKLFVKEVELFKAVDCWAIKEIERQGLTLDGNIKRQVLGEEVVKSIRFPLMSEKEFVGVVPDCNILTMKEVVDMMKYYNQVPLTTPLPFIQSPRSGPLLRCFRFNTGAGAWASPLFGQSFAKSDVTCFIPSKAIFLHGVQLFGREDGRYTVDVNAKVAEGITGDSSLFTQSGICVSKTYKDGSMNYFDVLFDYPVCLENGKSYKIILSITGPSAPHLTGKKTTVKCTDVTFTFSDTSPCFGVNSDQVAALIFSL